MTESEMLEQGEILSRVWAETWQRNFAHHYREAISTTQRLDLPFYPGADSIAFTVALSNADTFADALAYTGLNAEERAKSAARRGDERR